MLHVIATIRYSIEKQQSLLSIYKELIPHVLDEVGCIEYTPTLDQNLDLPNQQIDEARLQVIEKWENEAAFRAHLRQPHVVKFREQIQGIVTEIQVQVLSNFIP